MPYNETIVALSTPTGESALAMIRLSGPMCHKIGQSVTGNKQSLIARYARLGKYLDIKKSEIDQCIFTYYSHNQSFTGESMLEITPHGNPLIVQKILTDLISRGCRPAEPGEFTRTAFLNARMDLSQAEAVADLIRARSDHSLEIAQSQLNGSVGRKINELTKRLLGIIAYLEAYIDFSEEDLPNETYSEPLSDLLQLINEIKDIRQTRRFTALLHDGIKTLIVGEPNVGKSSLLNTLTGESRSIVSELPGTTRDYISSFIMLGPWRIEVLDTAGIHPTNNKLEKIGIEYTLEQAADANFFLLMLDATAANPKLPKKLREYMLPNNTLVIENKVDLPNIRSQSDFLSEFTHIRTSLTKQIGIDKMQDLWLKSLNNTYYKPHQDGIFINARHASYLSKAIDVMELASSKIRNKEHTELVVVDLREAVDYIGQIVGKIDNEQMLDCLFKQFCIGK